MDPQSPKSPVYSYLSLPEFESSHNNIVSNEDVSIGSISVADGIVHSESTVHASITLTEEKSWDGYCIYGDNVDKEVRPRHQTVSDQTKSLHMFQSFAQLDRINLTGICDDQPSPTEVDTLRLIPSTDDLKSVLSRMAIMVSRLETHAYKIDIVNVNKSISLYCIHAGFLSHVFLNLRVISMTRTLCGIYNMKSMNNLV